MRTIEIEVTNLAAMLSEAGLTQQEAADAIGSSQPNIARLVRTGLTARTSYGTVVGLAELLDVEPEELLEDSDED